MKVNPKPTEKTISVIVVDDHMVVREGIASVLRSEPGFSVVGEAANGAEALQLWRSLRPRIILMDLSMPVMDGVAAIQAIRKEEPKALIVVLTTYDGEADIYRGINAGAKGYLLKDVAKSELVHCLRTVDEGRSHIPSTIVDRFTSHVAGEALTAREVEVLDLVATGANNRTIASRLFVSEGTVKTHLKSILGKLDATSRTEAIVIASKRGLIRM